MDKKYLKVLVSGLNKNKVVVNLGGGHFVNLVGLEKRIIFDTDIENNIPYSEFQSDLYNDKQFSSPQSGVGKMVMDNKVSCYIPLETEYTHGGRQSKVRRSRRLHRRTTRRTRR